MSATKYPIRKAVNDSFGHGFIDRLDSKFSCSDREHMLKVIFSLHTLVWERDGDLVFQCTWRGCRRKAPRARDIKHEHFCPVPALWRRI